ncbi:MAG: hypothetical protein IT261_08570 [Saprospiraceae bacterium]|nr:hypothetical protein [Saprospiraceae bacterium]
MASHPLYPHQATAIFLIFSGKCENALQWYAGGFSGIPSLWLLLQRVPVQEGWMVIAICLEAFGLRAVPVQVIREDSQKYWINLYFFTNMGTAQRPI